MPSWLPNIWGQSDCDATATSDDSVNLSEVQTLEFDTVADLLANNSDEYRNAITWNYTAGDGIRGYWVKITNPALSDNGSDVRETDDGALVWRYATVP